MSTATLKRKADKAPDKAPDTKPAAQRTYASGISFSLPGWTGGIPLDVVPARRPNLSKESGFPYACPDHDSPVSVTKQFVCEDGHGPFSEDQLVHMRHMPDGPVWVTKAHMVESKTGSIEKNEIALRAHPADEVAAATLPSGKLYRVRPGKKSTKTQRTVMATLQHIAADPKIALVGTLRIQDSRDVYRLTVWHGQLLLVGLVTPADLAPVDEFDREEGPEIKAAAKQMRAALPIEPFEGYDWNVLEAVNRVLADGGADSPDTAKADESDVDLGAFLGVALGEKPKKKKISRSKVTAAA